MKRNEDNSLINFIKLFKFALWKNNIRNLSWNCPDKKVDKFRTFVISGNYPELVLENDRFPYVRNMSGYSYCPEFVWNSFLYINIEHILDKYQTNSGLQIFSEHFQTCLNLSYNAGQIYVLTLVKFKL